VSVLDDWVATVRAAYDLPEVDVTLILDLAREAAHNVARPAAPLTTYLLGIAVARGADPATAAARITALAHDFPAEGQPGTGDAGS